MSHLLSETEPFAPPLEAVLTQNRETYQRLAPLYDATGEARLAQAKRWLGPILQVMRDEPERLSVLELGPADGHLTGYMSSLGHDVTAVEFAPAMAAVTRKNAPDVTVIEADFLGLELPVTYDIVLCSAFAHLFPAPFDRVVLEKVGGLLRPGGIAYVATTIHNVSSAGLENKNGDLLRFRRRYTPTEFEDVMERSGLVPERFYVTRDRLSPSKTWANWIARGGTR